MLHMNMFGFLHKTSELLNDGNSAALHKNDFKVLFSRLLQIGKPELGTTYLFLA